MKPVHEGMAITEAQFNALAGDLIAVLKKYKVLKKEMDEPDRHHRLDPRTSSISVLPVKAPRSGNRLGASPRYGRPRLCRDGGG